MGNHITSHNLRVLCCGWKREDPGNEVVQVNPRVNPKLRHINIRLAAGIDSSNHIEFMTLLFLH